MTTKPVDPHTHVPAPHILVAATYRDETTGALYVHTDLVKVREDWENEKHVFPPSGSHRFGDVESWVLYVTRYAHPDAALLTWNAQGLRAELDHHQVLSNPDEGGTTSGVRPGRGKWVATHPFELSPEFRAWIGIANGQAIPHRVAIEQIEQRAPDIVTPPAADLMAILRSLRASVNAQADVELRPDGSSAVTFSQDKTVRGGPGSVELPPEFEIAVRVLLGHTDDQDRPVLYRMPVRLRVAVDDAAHLSLRFSLPTSERVLEDVFEDRVQEAAALLPETFRLLRAAN